MVLVSDKPRNNIGILQTKFSHREGHKTRGIGLQTVPLDEDIEGGHGEGQTRLKICPASMHHLFGFDHRVGHFRPLRIMGVAPKLPSPQ